MALTTHRHLGPRLKKKYSYNSTPLVGLRGRFYAKFTVTRRGVVMLLFLDRAWLLGLRGVIQKNEVCVIHHISVV